MRVLIPVPVQQCTTLRKQGLHCVSVLKESDAVRLLFCLVWPGALNGGGRPSDADEMGGSALRMLHQLANTTMAAEALARVAPPAVSTILAATRYCTYPFA